MSTLQKTKLLNNKTRPLTLYIYRIFDKTVSLNFKLDLFHKKY